MSDDKREYQSFTLTQPARMFFSHLFELGTIPNSNKEQWDLVLVMPNSHPDLAPIKRQAVQVFKDGAGVANVPGKSEWSFPWQSAQEYLDAYNAKREKAGKAVIENAWLDDTTLLKMHTIKFAPNLSVFNPKQGAMVGFGGQGQQPREACRAEFYPGRYVLAEFTFAYYPPVGKNGLPSTTLYLNSVAAVQVGSDKGTQEAGAARDPNQTFSAYVGRVRDVDPEAAPGVSSEKVDY